MLTRARQKSNRNGIFSKLTSPRKWSDIDSPCSPVTRKSKSMVLLPSLAPDSKSFSIVKGRHPSTNVDDDATKSPIVIGKCSAQPLQLERPFLTELCSAHRQLLETVATQGRRSSPPFFLWCQFYGSPFLAYLPTQHNVDCDSESYLASSLAPAPLPLTASAPSPSGPSSGRK